MAREGGGAGSEK